MITLQFNTFKNIYIYTVYYILSGFEVHYKCAFNTIMLVRFTAVYTHFLLIFSVSTTTVHGNHPKTVIGPITCQSDGLFLGQKLQCGPNHMSLCQRFDYTRLK